MQALNPEITGTIDGILAQFIDLKHQCPRLYDLGTLREFDEYQSRVIIQLCRNMGLEPLEYVMYFRQKMIDKGLR